MGKTRTCFGRQISDNGKTAVALWLLFQKVSAALFIRLYVQFLSLFLWHSPLTDLIEAGDDDNDKIITLQKEAGLEFQFLT